MAEIIKESERIYRLNIWPWGKQWHEGIQVFADEDENLNDALNETLSAQEKEELAAYLANPENYETSHGLAYVQGAIIRCSCGAEHQLEKGDSDCEGCGQPYNTFGQELRRDCRHRFNGNEGDDDNEDNFDENQDDEEYANEGRYYDNDNDFDY